MKDSSASNKSIPSFSFCKRSFLLRVLSEFPSPEVVSIVEGPPFHLGNSPFLKRSFSIIDKLLKLIFLPICLGSMLIFYRSHIERITFPQAVIVGVTLLQILYGYSHTLVCNRKISQLMIPLSATYLIHLIYIFSGKWIPKGESFFFAQPCNIFFMSSMILAFITVVVNCFYTLLILVVLAFLLIIDVRKNFRIVSDIPRQIYRNELDSDEKLCVFCFSEIINGVEITKLTTCQHIFHFSCGVHWLRKKPICPICKAHTRISIRR